MKIISQQYVWQRTNNFTEEQSTLTSSIYHFIREKVLNETIELKYCPTNDMIADFLTKGLSHEKFARFRDLAGVKEMKGQSASK